MAKSSDDVIKDITKKYGEAVRVDLTRSDVSFEVQWIPTGILALDAAVGKGLPRGRIIELFGPPSGGKSTACLKIISAVQQTGGKCAYVDMEHAIDLAWNRRLGVNNDTLDIFQPEYGEQALGIAEQLVTSNEYDIVVIDSVASLIPKAELEGDIEDNTVGLQARMMGKAMRRLVGIAAKTKTTVIFINQTRQKIGVMFGNPITTPGGESLKFAASVRINVHRISKSDVEDKGTTIGHRIGIDIPKNKVAPPLKKTEFLLMYDTGAENMEALTALAIAKGLITQSGASYTVKIGDSESKYFGQSKLIEALQDPIMKAHFVKELGLHEYYTEHL